MIRLSWFSPLPPARTDIANYTARLMPHLKQMVACRFLDPADEGCQAFFAAEPGSVSTQELNRADFSIYQLGNDMRHHGSILKLAFEHPGIIILHDRAINELMLGMAQMGGPDGANAYREVMARWYGADGLKVASAVLQGRAGANSVASSFPLFEAALDGALGVVVHNVEVGRELRERFPRLPLLVLPLPYPAKTPAKPCPTVRPAGDGKIQLAMFGFMGANRRVCEFINAWSRSPHKDRFRLQIAGELGNRGEIEALIRSYGLDDKVDIRGYLLEADLDAMIASADMVLNLRNPTMGEASGSQLRIWANAAASVVSDAGWYAQLPSDCVYKIPVDDEEAALQELLDRLARNKLDLLALGENGRQQLESHDPAAYATRLLQWLKDNRREMGERASEMLLIKTVAATFAQTLPANQTPAMPSRLLARRIDG